MGRTERKSKWTMELWIILLLSLDHNVTNIRCFTAPSRGDSKDGTACKLEHKCMYVMASGNLFLTPDHTFMQHALFYDMPFSEAQDLHDCGILRPRSHGNAIVPFHIVPFRKVERSGVAFTREHLK